MNLGSTAGLSLVVALIVGACGRVSDDDDDSSGGSGGNLGATGGALSGGGTGALGSGGKSLGLGGASTGGSIDRGGTNSSGGAIALGGSANTGGAIDLGGVGGIGDRGVGGMGIGGHNGDTAPLGKSSWDTTLKIAVSRSPSPTLSCHSASFTLHVEPSGGRLAVVSGRDGSVFPGVLRPSFSGADTFELSTSLSFPSVGDCVFSSILVRDIVLFGVNTDFDGVADRIEGAGRATGTLFQGDVGVIADLDFELGGVPDATPPKWLPPAKPHPLDGVRILASEPISLASTVAVVSDSGELVELSGYTETDGAFGNFSSPVVLPFGSSWSVVSSGTDLGHTSFVELPAPKFDVLADPGLFEQDGFESAPKGLLTGAAKIVTTIGNLPALAGTQSLFVPPSSTATFRLTRPSSGTQVRFVAQQLANSTALGSNWLPIEIGVVGGSERLRPAAQPTSAGPSPTGDATWSYAGPKQDFTVALSEGGADVVVRIAQEPVQPGGAAPQALLIDELRVE